MVAGILLIVAGILLLIYPPLLSIIVALFLILAGAMVISVTRYKHGCEWHSRKPTIERFFKV